MNRMFLTMIIILIAAHTTVFGQGDSLADMRRFLQVCNSYKQMPVELSVEIARHSTMASTRGDSSRLEAFFCLRPEGAYISMDGVEQLVNDSLMLLVNKTTKRMILYANRQSVTDRLRDYLGMRLADSSLAKLDARYRCSLSAAGGDTSVISVYSRAFLPQTHFPREEFGLRFNRKTDQPFEVIQLRRTLVMVSGDVYRSVAGLPEWTGKAVSVHDSVFFLVKEQTVGFRFRNISHDATIKLPSRISDRISAELPGKYQPAPGFANYVLNQQF